MYIYMYNFPHPSFSFCRLLPGKMIRFNPKVYDLINWLTNNLKIHIVWYLEKNIRFSIFNCYLASSRPTFGHHRGVSFSNSILISALKQLWPEVNGNLMARLGRYKPPGDVWVKIVESAVINIEVVGLSFWQWLKVGCGAAK